MGDFFDKDNLFGDDDDFGADDDFGGFDEDDGFFDDDLGLDDFGDTDDFGISDEDSDELGFSDDFDDTGAGNTDGSGGGPSRTFVLIAGLMIVILLVGLGLVAFVVLSGRGPSASQLTATAIAATNEVRVAQISASETQNSLDVAATMTATAMFTPSATPTLTPSITPSPTEDIPATETAAFESTIAAADGIATQNAVASATAFELTLNPVDLVTQDPNVVVPTLDPNVGVVTQDPGTTDGGVTEVAQVNTEVPTELPTVSLPVVQQTATALAILFNATPTPENITGNTGSTDNTGTTDNNTGTGTTVQPTANPGIGGGNLPDTGLFDDVFQGDPMFILLAAVGLLGVIVVSRTARSKRRDDE